MKGPRRGNNSQRAIGPLTDRADQNHGARVDPPSTEGQAAKPRG